MLPVEIQTRFEPIHSILAGLVKFLAVGYGLNEIAGGLRLYGSHIAPGPYDLVVIHILSDDVVAAPIV